MEEEKQEIKKCPISWSKRIIYMGFWFFFFKGIAWIVGIAIIYVLGDDIFNNTKTYLLDLFQKQ